MYLFIIGNQTHGLWAAITMLYQLGYTGTLYICSIQCVQCKINIISVIPMNLAGGFPVLFLIISCACIIFLFLSCKQFCSVLFSRKCLDSSPTSLQFKYNTVKDLSMSFFSIMTVFTLLFRICFPRSRTFLRPSKEFQQVLL